MAKTRRHRCWICRQAEQERVRAELDRLTADIAALAGHMRTSRDEGERFLADMLGFALQVPADAYVRVGDGRPVLVAWGHGLAGAATARVLLTGQAKRAAKPMAILPPPRLPAHRALKLAALLAALVLALLLLLAALYLALRDPFGWYALDVAACTVAPGELELQARLKTEDARAATLRSTLAQAGRRRRPTAAAMPADSDPGPPADATAKHRRATRAGARGATRQAGDHPGLG